ncbi:MAG: SCO family protein [Candidatus Rokubacteria bacterium]|nr:SCO family protein [Candidatus Rokubacteria bacterium]
MAQSGAAYFPNVPLITHEGRRVRFYDDVLRDRFVVVSFMYASCAQLCPMVTANLVRVKRLLGGRVGRDVFFYSITLRPATDTPEVLRRYATAHGTGAGWWFLTGAAADIDLVRRRLGAVDRDPIADAQAARHTGMVRYGNEALERWGGCPGEASATWIARAITSIMPAPRVAG